MQATVVVFPGSNADAEMIHTLRDVVGVRTAPRVFLSHERFGNIFLKFSVFVPLVPKGLGSAAIHPDAAYYHREMGEFILPYAAVRSAPSPDDVLLDFLESTYAAGADLAHWDRPALERSTPPGR